MTRFQSVRPLAFALTLVALFTSATIFAASTTSAIKPTQSRLAMPDVTIAAEPDTFGSPYILAENPFSRFFWVTVTNGPVELRRLNFQFYADTLAPRDWALAAVREASVWYQVAGDPNAQPQKLSDVETPEFILANGGRQRLVLDRDDLALANFDGNAQPGEFITLQPGRYMFTVHLRTRAYAPPFNDYTLRIGTWWRGWHFWSPTGVSVRPQSLILGSTMNVKSLVPFCGNALGEDGEQCDDGNNDNGDGCSSACTIEPPIAVP